MNLGWNSVYFIQGKAILHARQHSCFNYIFNFRIYLVHTKEKKFHRSSTYLKTKDTFVGSLLLYVSPLRLYILPWTRHSTNINLKTVNKKKTFIIIQLWHWFCSSKYEIGEKGKLFVMVSTHFHLTSHREDTHSRSSSIVEQCEETRWQKQHFRLL